MLDKRVLAFSLVLLAVIILLGGCNRPAGSGSPTSAPASSRPGITGTISTGASAALAASSIAPGGGTVSVSDPGNPLSGLALTVPANSYVDTRQFKISSAPVVKQTFGPNFNPLTPLISVDNGGGYSSQPMNVKIPVKVPAGQFAMGFIYDDQTHQLEGLPLVAQDDNSITIATRHFSSFMISSVSDSVLSQDIDSGFTPGIDDWQFTNYGSYITPGGECAGQSLTAIWYYDTKPDGAGVHLYGAYDNNGNKPATPGFWQDDSLGYRFASVIQSDMDWDNYASKIETQIWGGSNTFGQKDQETWKLFAYSILATGQPQEVAIYRIAGGGHAMIVYRVNNGRLYIADPNYPGNTNRQIEFNNGKFQPYNSGANARDIANGKGHAYETIEYLGKTAVIDWGAIAKRWTEVKNKTIGNDKFPVLKIGYRDDKNQMQELKDGYVSPNKLIKIQIDNPATNFGTFNYRGGVLLPNDAGGQIELLPGNNLIGIYEVGQPAGSTEYEYIDFKYFNIVFNAPTATSGSAWAWGMETEGQLGTATTSNVLTPGQVKGLSGVVSVAAGSDHSLVLASDGTVWAFGYNNNGQLGNGTTSKSYIPVHVSGLTGVTAIAANGDFSLALKSDGTVWGWGFNFSGQLGNGTTNDSHTPTQVKGLAGVAAISAGSDHALALKSDGTVWGWGSSGTVNNYGHSPIQVSGLGGVKSIAAGQHQDLAALSDGTVWGWGFNFDGELGNGTTTDSLTPTKAKLLTGVVSVALAGEHSMALTSDGSVWSWGSNTNGALGDGTATDRLIPVRVGGLAGVTAIAAGTYHSLALKSDGSVWAWGDNASGELGNGTTVSSRFPVPVSGLAGVVSISAGNNYSLAIQK